MDSITTRTSPASTLSPGLAFTCQTVPVISDLTSIRAMRSSWTCAGFARGEGTPREDRQYTSVWRAFIRTDALAATADRLTYTAPVPARSKDDDARTRFLLSARDRARGRAGLRAGAQAPSGRRSRGRRVVAQVQEAVARRCRKA